MTRPIFAPLAAAAAFALLTAGCASAQPEPGTPREDALPISAAAIESHMRFLADDLLEGRESGTRGYDLAALYVETRFIEAGLAPGGDDGYRQAVPLAEVTARPEAARLLIDGEALEAGVDYTLSAHPVLEESAAEGEAVFVGYGIADAGVGLDDYAGLDMEGCIAVAVQGAPSGFPADVTAHLSSRSNKTRAAAEAGAAGLLLITADGLGRTSYERLQGRAARPGMTTPASAGMGDLVARGYLSEAGASKLMAVAGRDLEALLEAARAGEALETAPLGVMVALAQATTIEPIESDNVIAVIPGSDPEVADETIIVTAHLDHLGVCRLPEADDAICNGVMDNAAGSAALIEVAVEMAKGPAPRRTVAFAALAAEERGLLGAAHLAEIPTEPVGTVAANVNLDMPVLTYPFEDVIAFGAEHSNLQGHAAAAAETVGATLSPDPMPEQGLFTRSDHYEFVRRGAPSVFIMTGFASSDPEADEGAAWNVFLSTRYHQPNDDFTQPVLFDQGARFATINLDLIRRIANAEESPAWNADSPFRPGGAR